MRTAARTAATISLADLMALPGARASVLFSSLHREELDLLLRSASFTSFSAGDTITQRHAPDDALHVLVRGSALERLWSSDRGHDYYARPLGAGEVIGITDVLSSGPVPHETRALVPAMTVRIPGAAVRGLLETSPEVAVGLSRVAVHALRTSEMDQVVLATGDAMRRVTHRLLELVAGWGTPGARGIDVDLPMTQAQLGAWAGVSRETTVKSLQWLRAEGLVHTSRRHIEVLDLPALEALAGHEEAAVTVHPRAARNHGTSE